MAGTGPWLKFHDIKQWFQVVLFCYHGIWPPQYDNHADHLLSSLINSACSKILYSTNIWTLHNSMHSVKMSVYPVWSNLDAREMSSCRRFREGSCFHSSFFVSSILLYGHLSRFCYPSCLLSGESIKGSCTIMSSLYCVSLILGFDNQVRKYLGMARAFIVRTALKIILRLIP